MRRRNSGQVLIITSLVVVMLLLSTVIYVNEVERDSPVFAVDATAGVSAFQQGAVHTVVSALVNVSNGGDPSVLSGDLAQFEAAVEGHTYSSISDLSWTLCDSFPYVNGIWVFCGDDGFGVSSMAADFVLNSSSSSGSYCSEFLVNVTSSVVLSGSWVSSGDSSGLVSLSVGVSDDGCPALASSLSFFYDQGGFGGGGWVSALPTVTDYGNGTYGVSFVAQNVSPGGLPVSLGLVDDRGVCVWANATLSEGLF